MKLINVICLAVFLSCNGSGDGGGQKVVDPVNPAAGLSDLGVQNEVLITDEQFQNEILNNFPEFHESPELGDRRSHESDLGSSYRFVLKQGGAVSRDETCVFSASSRVNSVISEKNNVLFTEKGTANIIVGALESGSTEVCSDLVPTTGESIAFEYSFANFSNGIPHFIGLMFRQAITHGKDSLSVKKDPGMGIRQVYKGSYQEQDVFRLVYLMQDIIEEDGQSGKLSYECQVIVNPNLSAHFSIIASECLADNSISMTLEDGDVLELSEKTRVLNRE